MIKLKKFRVLKNLNRRAWDSVYLFPLGRTGSYYTCIYLPSLYRQGIYYHDRLILNKWLHTVCGLDKLRIL